MTTEILPSIHKPWRSECHTKRQLALIAWTISNMPPGVTHRETIMLASRMTVGLTDREAAQVPRHLADRRGCY